MLEPAPFLFLDVDGVLLPFGGGRVGAAASQDDEALFGRLDLQLGPRLASLPCELVWATTWGETANHEISPRLGLPTLPVLAPTESTTEHQQEDAWYGLHWKTRPLRTWAGDRPFVWVDDEISDGDREWITAHHASPVFLHRVEPAVGLTHDEVDRVTAWLAQLA